MTDTADERAEKRFRAALARGGQLRNFVGGHTLFEGRGGQEHRLTYLDRTNQTRELMSSRLKISPGLRSVGNLYGASVQMATIGTGNAFAQEAVDGGMNGTSGGVSVRILQALQVAEIARDALRVLAPVQHKVHGITETGPHRTIAVRDLVDRICVEGTTLSEVAMRSGWWSRDGSRVVVRKKQAGKLKAALVEALEAIDIAWADRGIDARGVVGVVEVRR